MYPSRKSWSVIEHLLAICLYEMMLLCYLSTAASNDLVAGRLRDVGQRSIALAVAVIEAHVLYVQLSLHLQEVVRGYTQ